MDDAWFWVLLGFDIFLLIQLIATWLWIFFKMDDMIEEHVRDAVDFMVAMKKLEFERWIWEYRDDFFEEKVKTIVERVLEECDGRES